MPASSHSDFVGARGFRQMRESFGQRTQRRQPSGIAAILRSDRRHLCVTEESCLEAGPVSRCLSRCAGLSVNEFVG